MWHSESALSETVTHTPKTENLKETIKAHYFKL